MQAVLSSWKEIANYVGKGVRTVQRWERELGLPVHRPPGHDKGVVLAYPAELEAWIKLQTTSPTFPADGNSGSVTIVRGVLGGVADRLRGQAETLIDVAERMVAACSVDTRKGEREAARVRARELRSSAQAIRFETHVLRQQRQKSSAMTA
jgi:hypothetical protein